MRADLLMAIHFHQPIGNLPEVMERAFERCYKPFLDTVKRFPEIRMSFHFSGCLLEWLEKYKPGMIKDIRSMVKKGQIEIMGGAFYEPILVSIPERDRIAQIAMLSEYAKKNFSSDVKGAWVAERVWEPELASTLFDAGIKYVILDETHFLYAGVRKKDTYGYYMTDDNGKAIAVFPSDKVLRYRMPFRYPFESIDYMKSVAAERDDVTFVYGDDGEKFGEWPGTYEWVYKKEWLKNFFEELLKNRDWLKTMMFSECLERKNALGRVYLPACSYEEMLEWALPAEVETEYERILEEIKSSGKEERYKPFLRGGFWRNFLSKYPESNQMAKKMLYVSDRLHGLAGKAKADKAFLEAKKNLFRAQCNCAYWHGVFGGLYLYHLRKAVYDNLIRSEIALDGLARGKKDFCEARTLDYDADGKEEVILENRDLALYLDPADGGVMNEMDSRKACHNLTNTLTRRKEAYHRRILEKIEKGELAKDQKECRTIHDAIEVKDENLKHHLIYDRYQRRNLIDHFLAEDTDIDSFFSASCAEEGEFLGCPYDFSVKKSESGTLVTMKRSAPCASSVVKLEKKVTFPRKGSSVRIDYLLTNKGKKAVRSFFGPEFNITMPNADSPQYTIVLDGKKSAVELGGRMEGSNVKSLEIKDSKKELSLAFRFSDACRVWHEPIRTVSQSEKEYELNYQGSSFVICKKLNLAPGKTDKFSVEVEALT